MAPKANYSSSQYAWHYFYRLYLQCLRPSKFHRFHEQRTRPMPDNHSCVPFDQHRCIFVHIPKCAGISVSRSLFGNVSGAHHTLKKFQIMFGPREFSEYFKFSFARNPWDRLVSAYHFLKKGGLTVCDKKWSDKNLAAYPDFDAFVRNGIQQKKILSFPHFRPQVDYICLAKNRSGLDFIGYFENLEKDFAYICEQIKVNTTLQELNRNSSRKRDYRDYYTPETRQIVERIYADDIELLGYSFDNYTLPAMLAARRSS
jgi:hypothetical protein